MKITTKLFFYTFISSLIFTSCSKKNVSPLSCADQRVFSFPLVYSPTTQLNPNWTVILGEQKLFIKPVVDERNIEPNHLGKNIEDDIPYFICTSKNNPSEFIAQAFQKSFSALGVNLVDQMDQADLILQVTLKEFWVVEENKYRATLNVIVDASDRSKKILWRGPIFEESRDWGRSLTAEHYNNAFSNATLRVVQSLINNPEFKLLLGAK